MTNWAVKPKLVKHYEILRRLGSGGSGVVYYAYDTKLLRPVVLKVLRRGWASSEKMRETILREARLASAIEQPNVCSIYQREVSEALCWLRSAIYLGNENYPWFAQNPAWQKLQGNEDFAKILSDLKKTYRLNLQRWKQLFSDRAWEIGTTP